MRVSERGLWEKETERGEDLKNQLTPRQYEVTQENGTEPPFDNEYRELFD